MTLLRAEVLKLRRRPATYVLLAVLLGIVALVYLGLAASAGRSADVQDQAQLRLLLSFPNAYYLLVGITLSLGGLLAVMYGASVSGAEWAWGTIRTVVARGESRARYVVVKYVALALMLLLGILIMFVIGSVLAVGAGGIANVSTSGATDPATVGRLPDLLARTWLGIAEQAAIGFAIAMLFRSQLAGIGAGLALYFGQAFLGLVPALQDILPYLPFSVATSVITAPEGLNGGGTGGGAGPSLDSDTAVILAIAYLLIAVAIAALAAERSEIKA